MATITIEPIIKDGKSYVTKTDGNTATVVRTADAFGISQTEIDIAVSPLYITAILHIPAPIDIDIPVRLLSTKPS